MATILITGANRGIGLEFTRRYAADGWDIIACCRTADKAHELQALADDNSAIIIEQLDVRNHANIEALGEKYTATPLDVLLNNAGIIGPVPIADNIHLQHFGSIDYAVWQEVLETNTFGPIKLAETFVDNLAASKRNSSTSQVTSVRSPSAANPP
jgi:NAD(P)-dependent dehydrogenase (short-subunit alcohol dehydrogenase family)